MFYSVYSGHQSILIPPMELESSLTLWLGTLSQYRIRDTFCSYSVMELCTKGLGGQTDILKVCSHVYLPTIKGIVPLKMTLLPSSFSPSCQSKPIWLSFYCKTQKILWRTVFVHAIFFWSSHVLLMFFVSVWLQARGVNLSCVRSCVVVAEERPRLALTHSFSKLFKDIGLSMRAVSTAFGSRVNLAICLQVNYLKFKLLYTYCRQQYIFFSLIYHLYVTNKWIVVKCWICDVGYLMCSWSLCFSQGTTGPDPSTVYVDMKSLRHDR